MELTLNIYDRESKLIKKQYTTKTVDIFFGTVEDIIEVVDIDKLDDNMEWAKLILLSIKKLKPLLKEVFTGLTDEELKDTKVSEIIPLFIAILKFIVMEINGLGTGKN